MIGAIIGDIVGSRFEFDNCRRTEFELFHPESRFTDDTVCTMAVADWIINGRNDKKDSDRFAVMLQSWCRRYPMGDYGLMFRDWIDNPIPYNSFGNGAAMRISPLGDYFRNEEDLFEIVELVTSVSHNHPEGIKGAKAVALAISLAYQGLDKKEIYGRIVDLGYNLNFTCDQISKTNAFNETCQVTVPQAIVCFLESTDFESAIRLAVSIGGDSDTIACITAGIAEAYYGVPEWMKLEAVKRLPMEMCTIISRFYIKLEDKKLIGPIEEFNRQNAFNLYH